MPIIQSAVKRARQNNVRRARLQPVKTLMKTMMRSCLDAVKAGKKEDAQKLLPKVFKAIDMAAKKHLIHPKNAAHKKSAMSKLVAGVK
ncbi:30S ribosomal protein S20 [Candidatus Peregrinibacteria bacterium CG10_big_fil_rev_8_21_14_0_10_55_24]|nr:MAG: 30S ribosomal protein S20 [Candidatus Peregrinibacteria bacterium CG10_big_fil_rev_8_21_14_0_10_55_24]